MALSVPPQQDVVSGRPGRSGPGHGLPEGRLRGGALSLVTTRFNPRRLRLILDVNTRTAYAAGQWERFEKTKRALPYLRYVTKRDERVRDQHRSWHNLTLPVDDPFWNTHAPPNGWNCRCTLVGVTQRDYDKGTGPDGTPLNKTAPEIKQRDWYNARTGKTERVPEGIDPGWSYNPGKAAQRQGALLKAVDDKLEKLIPAIALAARRAGLTQEVVQRAQAAADALMKGLLAKGQAADGKDAIALFRALFKNEKLYTRHVDKRLNAGDIDSEQAYAEMTLKVLAAAETLVLAMPPEGVAVGLPVTGKISTGDGEWIVLLNSEGGIITSYPYIVGKETFEQRHADHGHKFYEIPLGSDYRAALAAIFGID